MHGPSQWQMKPGCLATKYKLQIWLRVLVAPIAALPYSSRISDPGSSNLLITSKEFDLSPRHSWLFLWDSSLFQSKSHPVLLRLGCQNLTFRQLEQRQRNIWINKKGKLFCSLNAISDIKFDSPGIWREERKDRSLLLSLQNGQPLASYSVSGEWQCPRNGGCNTKWGVTVAKLGAVCGDHD